MFHVLHLLAVCTTVYYVPLCFNVHLSHPKKDYLLINLLDDLLTE